MIMTIRLAMLLLLVPLLAAGFAIAEEKDTAPPVQGGAAEKLSPGQADLDEATKLKIAARSFEDLSKVIERCEKAIKAGLTDENREFAEQLLVGTRLQRANQICSQIFDRNPPNENWRQLARAALIDLELAIRVQPKVAETHLLLGRIHALPGGNSRRAVASFDKAIEFAGDNRILKSQALTYRGEAKDTKQDRLADFNEALKLVPDNAAALRARGLHYMQQNKHEKAVSDFQRAIELEPEHAKTHEALAIQLLLNKDVEKAKASLDEAIKLAPKSATAYAYRARVLLVQKKFDDALTDINRALKMVPDSIGWLLMRAEIFEKSEQFENALLDIETVIKLKPDFFEAVRRRAALLVTADRIDEAIKGLQSVVEEHPDQLELRMTLGVLYHSKKEPRKAIEQFNRVAEADVKHWALFRHRADALLSIGKQAEALRDYESALKLNPTDPGILNNLSWLLCTSPDEKLRNGERAVELAEKAAKETDHKAAYILSTLAAAYAETGDFKKAVEWSEKAGALGEGDIKGQLSKELESYKSKKPWRELQNIEGENPGKKKEDKGQKSDE
ncbi:MAG: tetratricopeptide repeat protein [Pirellulales bacterium]